jgi:hypothetical protein
MAAGDFGKEIVLTQDNRPRVLSSIDYPEAGVLNKPVSVSVDAAALKLHDGPATLTLTAVDHSLWKNRTTMTRPVTIDFVPPQVSQLNPISHINPGGACVLTYRLSEAAALTGVQVGDLLFPAYPTIVAGQPGYVVYFALPMDATQSSSRIRILARDPAGNETVSGIPVLIMNRKFRSDKMSLSDTFLSQKMPEFQAQIPELKDKPLLETFIYVNTKLRSENLQTLQEFCRKTEPRQLWQDTFIRMKNAAPMALFGDRRTYVYGSKVVGKASTTASIWHRWERPRSRPPTTASSVSQPPGDLRERRHHRPRPGPFDGLRPHERHPGPPGSNGQAGGGHRNFGGHRTGRWRPSPLRGGDQRPVR